ncbi:MAG: FimV/HubP family polar landmark protein [Cardiobacterium sp.]
MNRNQTPARLRHTVALAVGLGCSSAAISIGLGPIHVNSSIGQPMSATIPVDGMTAAAAKGATVQLASPAAYRAQGVELLPIHKKLRFSLVPSGKGYVIRVTSSAAIREPFVNFMLTINSNGSTVTREYAAFFNADPLNPNAAEPMAIIEKPTLADSDSKGKKKGKKDKAENSERELLPIGEPESRSALADNRKAAKSEPVLANPKKDKEKNKKDKAKEKEQLAARSKAAAPLRAASADSEGWGGHDLATQPKQARPVLADRGNNDNGDGGYSYYSASVKPGSIPVGSKYGPVKSNETLFSIANAARPSESVSIQQMMRAIYDANRGSFAHNDMGNLMVGSTLTIPDPGAAAMPAAKTEIADNGAKAKAEAKKAEKAAKDKADAAKAAAAGAAAAAADNALAQNDAAEAKAATDTPVAAAELAQNNNAGDQDNKAAAPEVAQNDTPAAPATPENAAENAPLDGNALTLDGADTLVAANNPQPQPDASPEPEPVDLTADNPAPEVAANDTPAEAVAVQPEPAAPPAPAEETPPVEVASNDAAPAPAAPAVVPEMKSETIAAVAQEKPEDKISSGLPLPLLAAAGTGVLALGGAAAFMLAKRKRRDDSDEDSIEEFSAADIERLAAEMDSSESQKIGDKVGEVKIRNAAPASTDVDGLERLDAQLSELDDLNKKFSGLPKYRDEYDDGEPHSADELPDDFFKDLEIPEDEPAAPVAAVAGNDRAKQEPTAIAVPPASDSDEDYDFFNDLEKLSAEDEPAAPLKNGKDHTAKAEPHLSAAPAAEAEDSFDDFLAFASEDAPAAKPAAKAEATPVAEEKDDFDDFLSFASDEEPIAQPAAKAETAPVAEEKDDFNDFLAFAEEEPAAPATKAENKAEHADKTAAEPEDDFDFLSFAEEEPAAPAKQPEAAKAEPAPAADAGDDFDFLSFAEEETSTPAKQPEPAKAEPAPAADAGDDFDFLSFAEEEPAAPAKQPEVAKAKPAPKAADDAKEAEKPAAHHTVVSDAVVIAAEPAAETQSDALDFFALEDEPARAPEAAAPVAAADDDETLDFFSDDSSNSETVAAAKAEPAPAAKPAPAATVAPAASDADVDVEAMEINLDMATSFIVMGKAEKARSWLDEVLESGSESQKVRARSMLAQLDK